MDTNWTSDQLRRAIVICDPDVDRRTCANVEGMLRLGGQIEERSDQALDLVERYLERRGMRMSVEVGPAGRFLHVRSH